jgi:EAL domain-containing protein (putative c-di-GMP-specific phosphodiesterase class I)
LPLDRVKLDRSLIARHRRSGRAASIANAIINLCRDLGVAVTSLKGWNGRHAARDAA